MNIKRDRGIIHVLLLIVIVVVILGFFKINVKDVISAPIVQQNLNYVWELIVQGFYYALGVFIGFFREVMHSVQTS